MQAASCAFAWCANRSPTPREYFSKPIRSSILPKDPAVGYNRPQQPPRGLLKKAFDPPLLLVAARFKPRITGIAAYEPRPKEAVSASFFNKLLEIEFSKA
jgi:hypothetical protein